MVDVRTLEGKKVITIDAYDVGETSGAAMDDQWKITHVYVNLSKQASKELGFDKPFMGHVAICLPVNLIQAYGNVITLNKKKDELQGIPECNGS